MNSRQNTPVIRPNRVRKYPGRMPQPGPGRSSTPTENPAAQQQMMDYLGWLNAQAVSVHSPDKIQAYREVALATRKVGKREVRTFAPFQQQLSALQVITPAQIRFLISIVLCWSVGLFFLHGLMFTLTLGVITTLYVGGFLLSVILATHALSGGSGEQISDDMIALLDQMGAQWPSYTILCPLFKEVAVVSQFVQAMSALNYPASKLQVLFLTEENDPQTRAALLSMNLPPHFSVLTVPKGTPQTKPRACNFGLLQATGQFVVIFDAEDKPEPNQLKKAVLTFAHYGSDLACVQAKLNFYNSEQNVLTRLFTAEYSLWFDIMLPGLQHSGLALPLGGTSNHFRTDALRALGGWDPFNVTEDCDAGLRLAQYKLTTAVLNSTTYEEATSRPKVWLFQRSRWIKGYMQTYLVHMRYPLQTLRSGGWRRFFSLQVIVGAWTAVLLLNPLMWLLSLLYLILQPVTLYHQLFPTPIFYMGTICFVFGNFFYLYLHMIGCLRRKHYSLIKWVLLIPLYWGLMSVSAYIALYQLIVKPHYWEKTQHGNHLKQPGAQAAPFLINPVANSHNELGSHHNELGSHEREVAASLPTMRLPAVFGRGILKRPAIPESFGSATREVPIVRTALGRSQRPRASLPGASSKARLPRLSGLLIDDRWLLAAIFIAIMVSTAATVYTFQQHWTLANVDSISHLEIGRRLLDNITPGLAQLGGVWLPLPHLLIALFAWNDFLWSTGLAGSLVGMLCYLVTVILVFLAARRLTHSSSASFIGTLVFALNPNVLYLQATPLSEPVCWATFTMACYYLLAWVQEDKNKYLVWATGSTFLATMARYDGWVLLAVFPVVILLVGLLKHHTRRRIEGQLMMFCVLGSLGVWLWLAWGQIIFGDPLYFLRGPQSAQAQTIASANPLQLYQQHNLPADIQVYGLATIETLGLGLFLLALIGLACYLFRKWRSPEVLAVLAFLAPFAFYVVALYAGQVGLFDNGVVFYPLGIIPISQSTHLFNGRFGSEMVAPLAIFVALLVPSHHKWGSHKPNMTPTMNWGATLHRWGARLGKLLLLLFVIFQSAWIIYGGAITVIAQTNPPNCVLNYAINVYLSQHYNGGHILQTDYPFLLSESQEDIHFSNVIYEGSGPLWQQALHHPETMVDWVVFAPGDDIAQALAANDPHFVQQFTLVATGPKGMRLYHKSGLPPLPTHPVPPLLAHEQQFCTYSNYHIYN
ncbi:MAG TPA: glycosyltransferase [Ktedonobacteraceae bacterium]|nr:glycosyltransferase [Ktedonobacteraceae bacterium]